MQPGTGHPQGLLRAVALKSQHHLRWVGWGGGKLIRQSAFPTSSQVTRCCQLPRLIDQDDFSFSTWLTVSGKLVASLPPAQPSSRPTPSSVWPGSSSSVLTYISMCGSSHLSGLTNTLSFCEITAQITLSDFLKKIVGGMAYATCPGQLNLNCFGLPNQATPVALRRSPPSGSLPGLLRLSSCVF